MSQPPSCGKARLVIFGAFPIDLLVPPPEPVETGGWRPEGAHVQHHPDRLAMVFCDHGRPGMPWLAALRGSAAGRIDPAFLTDPQGRIMDFATADAARFACEAVLQATLARLGG